MYRFKLVFLFMLFFPLAIFAQQWKTGNYHTQWGDSLLKKMSMRDQIAQTMMVAAWSNKDVNHTIEIEELIRKYHIGGVIFFQGTPLKQAYLTNYYQQLSSIPLMVGIDGEWGLAMRLQGVPKLPFQMTLGAAADTTLTYQSGFAMGLQCKRMGIHVNFAPDVDVNTNPQNPIIGFRSFGADASEVGRYGIQMTRGLQDAGVMACAKHFPGHGDSKGDSHLELPMISHNKNRLEEVELYPFRETFESGVMSAMVGHLEIPALDSVRHRPSSLSRPIVTDLLQKEMGFKGLIFTDALNMDAVSRYYGTGYAEAAALMAGNDVLLFPGHVPTAISIIEQEVRAGTIDSAEIAEHVRKILYFKYLSGLNQYKPIETSHLLKDLSEIDLKSIAQQTADKSITVVTDQYKWLPLDKNTKTAVAIWTIGKEGKYPFTAEVQKHQNADVFFTHRDSGYEVFNKMSDSLVRSYDQIIISIHDQNLWGKKSQLLPQQIVQNILYVAEKRPSVVVLFGNIYLLKNLPHLPCAMVAYEDGVDYQKTAAQILYGLKPALGHLPATAYEGYSIHQGVETWKQVVGFEHITPVSAGFTKDFGPELMGILNEARFKGATPGGQLLVLKNGKAVFDQPWGHFYYDSSRPVTGEDMYDLASITKVAATTLSVMKLYEKGKLNLDEHIHEYLPELKGTNKEKLTLRQLLLHEAGLPAWIPFYKEAMIKANIFSQSPDSVRTICVSDMCYMDTVYTGIIWKTIVDCPVEKHPGYKYSDLGLIITARIIERISGKNVAQFAYENFYQPMNLRHTKFNPADYFVTSQMAPTVNDQYFRNQTIQGYVHDPAAAMMGGISGNAGLFSNATELGAIFQMLLDGGAYNGTQYLRKTTITEFTRIGHKKTHRGLGFDKPNGLVGNKANISEVVPSSLFGHTGFTGNWVWADPSNQIVFVFLSNRTFPNEDNKLLTELNIRTRAIEAVYKSLPKTAQK